MKSWRYWLVLPVMVIGAVPLVWGLEPTKEELGARAQWAAAKFDLSAPAAEPAADAIVVVSNHDPVQKDSRNGRPMKIGETDYTSGLYCHAPSRLEVKLAKPAEKFSAVIGVDHNGDTSGGRGSVEFQVKVHDNVLFASDVMRGGGEPVPIEVPLRGANRFTLMVSDTGDGIACDQADWADAYITYTDGTRAALSSIPIAEDGGDRTNEPAYPFEFTYGGRPSRDFLADWKLTAETRTEGEKRFRTLTFDEPRGALQVRCEAIEYLDFPTVEWKLFFKNTGSGQTKKIENILPLSTTFSREAFVPGAVSMWDQNFGEVLRNNRRHEFLLHHFVGAPSRIDDYLPLESELGPGGSKQFLSGGRPLSGDMPYFNVQAGDMGWIVVIGWPGQWKAAFTRGGGRDLTVTAGQGQTSFVLRPGEEVRTPLAVVQNWSRASWLEAQNVWRAWMIRHNVPRQPDGSIAETHLAACSSHWYAEMTQADTASQNMFIDRYLEENIPLDYWWMDAGWYPCDGSWPKTGTWEVDQTRFPGGFRPITDHGRARGVRSIIWFEPERVAPGTYLTENHPDWILGGAAGGLLNLGNPQAWNWLTDHVDGMIKKEGIDLYRQDFNMDPLSNWRDNDQPDRLGITEIGHVTGYLAYWDALLARNPGLRIDTCASGGNRNDLETLRRAVPLLRSDYILEAVGNQNHTFGASLWIPFHGTGWRALDDYGMRSTFVPYLNLCYDVRDKSLDYDRIRANLKAWKDIFVPLFAADYYPLTALPDRDNQAIALQNRQDVWFGWQYNDPKTGKGAIQMFRRLDSKYESGRFPLYGLDAEAVYTVSDYDTGNSADYTGGELMTKGLPIVIDEAPKAVILTFEKK